MTNKKQSLLDAIIDLGIECCNMDNHGTPLTRDIILGKDKHENVQMTRTIIVNQIHLMGYTHSTIAIKFGRTTQAVCKILNDAHPAFLMKCEIRQLKLPGKFLNIFCHAMTKRKPGLIKCRAGNVQHRGRFSRTCKFSRSR